MEEIGKKVDQAQTENKRTLEQFASEVNERFKHQQETLETLEKEQKKSVASFHVGLQERIDLSEKIMETALLEDKGYSQKSR